VPDVPDVPDAVVPDTTQTPPSGGLAGLLLGGMS